MDQDSFRELLSKGGSGSGSSSARAKPKSGKTSRGSLFSSTSQKPKASTSSEGAGFKPRNVKSAKPGAYRDRATERRAGDGNDYAQVEAVLEEFEKQHADEDKEAVEHQRKYLGGDSEHSILVKGLDMALYEQNKARLQAVQGAEDDETLEETFNQSASAPPASEDTRTSTTATKKRTREDVIREIKEKRLMAGSGAQATAGATVDLAKSSGKFKPIGFKPIGPAAEEKNEKKRKKSQADAGEGGELKKKKKKKRKVDPVAATSSGEGTQQAADVAQEQPVEGETNAQEPIPQKDAEKPRPPPVEEPIEDEGDIFAGAGDYDVFAGLGGDDSDDEDEDAPSAPKAQSTLEPPRSPPRRANWFNDGTEEDQKEPAQPPPAAKPEQDSGRGPGHEHAQRDHEMQSESEDEQPMRLQPLHSSAVPSIKELLDMDTKSGKKRGGKKKKKVKKKGEDKGGDSE